MWYYRYHLTNQGQPFSVLIRVAYLADVLSLALPSFEEEDCRRLEILFNSNINSLLKNVTSLLICIWMIFLSKRGGELKIQWWWLSKITSSNWIFFVRFTWWNKAKCYWRFIRSFCSFLKRHATWLKLICTKKF